MRNPFKTENINENIKLKFLEGVSIVLKRMKVKSCQVESNKMKDNFKTPVDIQHDSSKRKRKAQEV